MTLQGHDTRDIFPDFRSFIHPPVSAAWFQPKAWGIAAEWHWLTKNLTHAAANFQTKNVQVGDACYIMAPDRVATTVAAVHSESIISTIAAPGATQNNVLYKVGHGQPHTIQTLAQILGARGLTYSTIHHGKLWTGARIPQWNTDETGDIYVIGHDTKKARWLDGQITMPVGFPDEPDRPPEEIYISAWETHFPGLPRPDYPAGLEPGGDLRAALIAEHGSLLAAEEALTITI